MKQTRSKITSIVGRWKKIFGLDSWEVKIDFETLASEGANASVFVSADYERARIMLEHGWESWSDADANLHMCHELMHCLLRDSEHVVKDLLGGYLHRDVHQLAIDQYQHAEERVIDNLSRAMIRLA